MRQWRGCLREALAPLKSFQTQNERNAVGVKLEELMTVIEEYKTETISG